MPINEIPDSRLKNLEDLGVPKGSAGFKNFRGYQGFRKGFHEILEDSTNSEVSGVLRSIEDLSGSEEVQNVSGYFYVPYVSERFNILRI